MSQISAKDFRKPRPFELAVVALCLLALALLGPLRGLIAPLPLLAFAAALVLFAVPGALMTRWFARGVFPGPALAPAALALGMGIYGLLGVPALLMHTSLELYLATCGIVLMAFLIAAGFAAFRPEPTEENNLDEEDPGAFAPGYGWLWVPFMVLGGGLVFLTGVEVPWIDGDTWNYLAWVRDHLEAERLVVHDPYFGNETGPSRVVINGFLLEQAALSQISGLDPVKLVIRYLSPTLSVGSLLAFYALGRRLIGSGPALLAGCLYALFLLLHLDGPPPLFGSEFLGRVVQDKGVARFVFLPVALCFAAGYLEERKFRYLLLFGFTCWASVSVHPAGLAVIGLSVAGFGLLHVTMSLRQPSAYTTTTALGLALLSILVVPVAYVLVAGRSLSSALYSADIGASDPVVLANQVFVREEWMNIFILDDGSYIMHPSLVLEPAIAAAYVLGVPFLLLILWRARGRPIRRESLAAQLLLGMLLVATVASYVPPVATFLGDEVVAPGQLHRLSWPIPLAAFLTLGWMLWATLRWVAGKLGLGLWIVPLTILILISAMMAAAAPRVVPAMATIYGFKDIYPEGRGARLDPVFWWMGRNITEPNVILAPDTDNVAIPAYVSEATVVSFRGDPVLDNLEESERVSGTEIEVPQGALDVRQFHGATTPERRLEILRRYDVGYVLAPANNPLLIQNLAAMPVLNRLETPGERYVLFEVDLPEVGGR